MKSLVRIAIEFAFGMAIYTLRRHWELGDLAGVILAGSLVTAAYLFPGADGLQVGLLGLLIAALSSDRDLLARLLARPWPVYLGEISYSIYMSHWFIWSVLRRGIPSKPGPDGRYADCRMTREQMRAPMFYGLPAPSPPLIYVPPPSFGDQHFEHFGQLGQFGDQGEHFGHPVPFGQFGDRD